MSFGQHHQHQQRRPSSIDNSIKHWPGKLPVAVVIESIPRQAKLAYHHRRWRVNVRCAARTRWCLNGRAGRARRLVCRPLPSQIKSTINSSNKNNRFQTNIKRARTKRHTILICFQMSLSIALVLVVALRRLAVADQCDLPSSGVQADLVDAAAQVQLVGPRDVHCVQAQVCTQEATDPKRMSENLIHGEQSLSNPIRHTPQRQRRMGRTGATPERN